MIDAGAWFGMVAIAIIGVGCVVIGIALMVGRDP